MFASFAHSGSFVSSHAEVVSGAGSGAVQAARVKAALSANKALFIVSGLVLVELAAIAGLVDFAIGRNSDVPFFEVAVFITVVKEEAYLLFHVLAHNDEQVRFRLMNSR